MKRESRFRSLVTGICCAAMLMGQLAQAASPVNLTASRVADVALDSAGELHGQVLDGQGVPQSQVKVALGRASQAPTTYVSTDADGNFTVAGLSAGVYQVQTAHGSSVYRVWAPRTAPPSAQAGVLVINDHQVVRGFGGGRGHFLSNPWVMGLVVAAAIAIPLALDSGS